jgi:hypothetical protein
MKQDTSIICQTFILYLHYSDLTFFILIINYYVICMVCIIINRVVRAMIKLIDVPKYFNKMENELFISLDGSLKNYPNKITINILIPNIILFYF